MQPMFTTPAIIRIYDFDLFFRRERSYKTLKDSPDRVPTKGRNQVNSIRREYLKEHHPGTYSELLLEGKLNRHLAEVEETAYDYLDRLTSQMAKAENVTEALKAENQMEWVQRMNSIRDRADEIILRDFIYC